MAKLAARCYGSRLLARCPNVRLPARCVQMVPLPIVGECLVNVNVPVFARILPDQCGITLESNYPYYYSFGLNLPWGMVSFPPWGFQPLQRNHMSIANWGGYGAWSSANLTREQVDALLGGAWPPPNYIPCPGTGIQRRSKFGVFGPAYNDREVVITLHICWYRNESENTTVGIAHGKLWRYVMVHEGPWGESQPLARNECCCGHGCERVTRPGISVYYGYAQMLGNVNRFGPVWRNYREADGEGDMVVRCVVPGVFSTWQAFVAAWWDGLATQAQVTVDVRTPVVHRQLWYYLSASNIHWERDRVWILIEKFAGGNVTYECSNVVPDNWSYYDWEFQSPPTETYFAASGFVPAPPEVEHMSCVRWYPPGAVMTNGVWTTPVVNAAVRISPSERL